MNLEIKEDYEELAIEWQYQLILILKETLARKGIQDAVAKDIIGDFVEGVNSFV